MGYFTINKLKVRVTKIQEDQQLQRPTKPILGSNGSHTAYLGMGGRLLTLTIRCETSEAKYFKALVNKAAPVTVISESKADYNGIYHITGYKPEEYQKGAMHITMTLQENYTFNITRQNFINYQIKISNTANEIQVGEKYTDV